MGKIIWGDEDEERPLRAPAVAPTQAPAPKSSSKIVWGGYEGDEAPSAEVGAAPVEEPDYGGTRRPLIAGMQDVYLGLKSLGPAAKLAATGNMSAQEASDYLASVQERQAKFERLLPGGPRPFSSVTNPAEFGQWAYEGVATTVPRMVGTGIGIVGGGAIGTAATAETGPGMVPGGLVGATIGGTLTGAPSYVADNLARASEGGTKPITRMDVLKSGGAALFQSALDTAELEAGGVGLKALAEKNLLTAVGVGAAVSGPTEMVTEPAQQLGERWAAGLPLWNKEARGEYKTAAIEALALGSVMGGTVAGGAHLYSRVKGRGRSGIDPERQTGEDVQPATEPGNDRTTVKPAKPQTQRAPLPVVGATGAYNIDEVLDRGVAPQETGGRPQQTSVKGALGKYQLLPSTALGVATRLGLPTDNFESRVLNDDNYNRTLARGYLGEMLKKYNGDMFLALTAYHGGPANTDKWIKQYGYNAANPQAFLEGVAQHNPVSARYAPEVLGRLGQTTNVDVPDLFGDQGGTETAAAPQVNPLDEIMQAGEMDLAENSVIKFLRTNVDESVKASPSTTALAKAIAKGDDEATTAISAERAALDKKLEELAAKDTALGEGTGMAEGSVARAKIGLRRQMALLQARENALEVATQAAARAAQQRARDVEAGVQQNLFDQGAFPARGLPPTAQPAVPTVGPEALGPQQPGVNLVTEPVDPNAGYPVGRRAPFPSELESPGPGGQPTVEAASTRLAEGLRAEEQTAQQTAAQQAAVTQARQTILDDVLKDPKTHSPRERMVARLKRAGMDPNLTPEEEQATRAHQLVQQSRGVSPMSVMAEEALAQQQADEKAAAEEQRKLAQQQRQEQQAQAAAQRQQKLDEAAAEQAALPEQDTTLGVKARPEPAAAPAPEPAAASAPQVDAVTSNVAERVDAQADRIGEANPRQAAWFRRGAAFSEGDTTVETPTGPRQKAWFDQGRDFAADERARQEQEGKRGAARERRPERKQAARKARDEAIAAGKARQAKRQAAVTKPVAEPKPELPKAPTRAEGIAAREAKLAEQRKARRAEKKARKEKAVAETAKREARNKVAREKRAAARPPAAKEAVVKSQAKVEPKTVGVSPVVAKLEAQRAAAAALKEQQTRIEEDERLAEAKARAEFAGEVDKAVPADITKWQAQRLNQLTDLTTDGKPTYPIELLRSALAAEKARFQQGGGDPAIGEGETFKEFLTRIMQAGRGAPAKLSVGPNARAKGAQNFAQLQNLDRILRAELDRRGLADVHLFTTTLSDLFAAHGQKDAQGVYHDTYDGLGATIEVAMDAENPLRVLNHEIVHALRAMGVIKSGDWTKLVKLAMSSPDRMAYIEESYGHLSEDEQLEEAVAELFADWTTNPTPQAKTPDSTGIIGRIKAFFAALKRAITRSDYNTAEDVMRAMDSGAAASNNVAMTVASKSPTGVKSMILGQKARTADLMARDEAMRLQNEGMSKRGWFAALTGQPPVQPGLSKAQRGEVARKRFGWFYDAADKFWKFEADDSRAKWKTPFADWPETKLFGKSVDMKLGDVLHHPDLFAAYPELVDMRITKMAAFLDISQSVQGWYNEDTQTINITPYAVDPRGTLMHEIQHAVQGIEGFARGANPESMKINNKENMAKLGAYYERMAAAEQQVIEADPDQAPATTGGPTFTERAEALEKLKDPKSEPAQLLATYEQKLAAFVQAKEAVAAKREAQDAAHIAKRAAYDAERAKLRTAFEHANSMAWTGPKDDRPAWRKKADAAQEALLKQPYLSRDWAAEGAETEPLRFAANAAQGEMFTAKFKFEYSGPYSSLQYDLYQLVAGEVEARDTAWRQFLSADERRALPPGSQEGILSQEKLVTFKIGGDASGSKFSRVPKRDLTPQEQELQADLFHIDTETDQTLAQVYSTLPPPVPNNVKQRGKRTAAESAYKVIATHADNLGKGGHIWMAGTKDIISIGKKYAPSMGELVELQSRTHALGRDFQERLLEIKDAHLKVPKALKGNGPNSLNAFIHDSTTTGKWGFEPSYHPPGVADVDPELVKRFKAIEKQSPVAADVIKAAFRFGHEARNALGKATLDAVNAEYDPLIAAATTPEQVADLSDAKHKALAYFSRVFDTREGLPYAPLTREGNWIVVGKSAAYKAAEKAKDHKAIEAMQGNAEHYFVDMKDTVHEAEALHNDIKGHYASADYFERGSEKSEAAFNTDNMPLAFKQLQNAIASEMDKGSRAAKEMHRLATDLYLHSLTEQSARKAELGRKNVSAVNPETGEVPDMMRAIWSRGNATANYIASVSNQAEMQRTLIKVRDEINANTGKMLRDGKRLHNEVMYRYTKELGKQTNRVVDAIVRGTSIWTLLTLPGYYIQNGTQTAIATQPLLASKYGYWKSAAAIARAYGDFMAMTKDIGLLDRVDFKKAPADVRAAMDYLAKHGHLDAGYSSELGHMEMNGEGILPSTWNPIDRFFRTFPQRVEVMNRTVAGIAAYRLATAKGKQQVSPEAAQTYAGEIIDHSHGDYSGWNSPHVFHIGAGGIGKLTLQFRKFQFINTSMYVREINRAFRGASREEKIQGALALGYINAHMLMVGGIRGLPGAALVGSAIMLLLKAIDDDKDWKDWVQELRLMLGAGKDDKDEDRSWWADFLYKGAPYALAGVDMSDRLGMGNALALAPYSGIDEAFESQAKYQEAVGKMILGAPGGIPGKAINGWGYGVEQGDWIRFWEGVAPSGIAAVMKAHRLKTKGQTTRAGDTLIPAEEISWPEAITVGIGLTPRQLANQTEQASELYAETEFHKNATSRLYAAYTKAFKTGDKAEMDEVVEEWKAYQDARVLDGFKRQPLVSLRQAPFKQKKREGKVVGGLPTTAANRRAAMIATGQLELEEAAP